MTVNSLIDEGTIAFAHLDVDQSYVEGCRYLEPRMVAGGVMWFDDYCLSGAKKAIDEMYGGRLIPMSGKVMVRF